jgi:TonB family protein
LAAVSLAAMTLTGAARAATPSPASQPAPGAPSVAPLTVSPDVTPTTPPAATVDVPNDDTQLGQWASVWPAGAYAARLSGHVVLTCQIDRYGIAEWCKVASETPAGHGFGDAALELRPTFKLKPPIGPDGAPTTRVVNIAVEFKAPDPQYDFGSGRGGGSTGGGLAGVNGADVSGSGGNNLTRHPVSMLNNPVWASTVSYSDLIKAYPAHGGGAEGYAVAHCEVNRNGSLTNCQPIKEAPADRGFGAAAARLAAHFRVAPQWTTAPGHADVWVDVPIRFPAPGAQETRTVASPYWITGFDPEEELKVYPPEAAAQGVSSGYGVVSCVVGVDGALTGCTPQEAEPSGLGFSEAAVRLASTMRMNPWTADGAPVDGAVVRVGFRLTLKP